MSQHRRDTASAGQDLGDLDAQRNQDRSSRHLVVQAQLHLITVQDHRPARLGPPSADDLLKHPSDSG